MTEKLRFPKINREAIIAACTWAILGWNDPDKSIGRQFYKLSLTTLDKIFGGSPVYSNPFEVTVSPRDLVDGFATNTLCIQPFGLGTVAIQRPPGPIDQIPSVFRDLASRAIRGRDFIRNPEDHGLAGYHDIWAVLYRANLLFNDLAGEPERDPIGYSAGVSGHPTPTEGRAVTINNPFHGTKWGPRGRYDLGQRWGSLRMAWDYPMPVELVIEPDWRKRVKEWKDGKLIRHTLNGVPQGDTVTVGEEGAPTLKAELSAVAGRLMEIAREI